MITSYPCTQSHLLSSKRKSVTKRTKSSVIRFDKGRPILLRIMKGKKRGTWPSYLTCWMRSLPFSYVTYVRSTTRHSSPAAFPPSPLVHIPPEASAAQPYNSCRNVIIICQFTQYSESDQPCPKLYEGLWMPLLELRGFGGVPRP